MRVQCHHCDKKYTLPAARVAGRILKIRCRQCQSLFTVDGSDLKVPEHLSNTVLDVARLVADSDSRVSDGQSAGHDHVTTRDDSYLQVTASSTGPESTSSAPSAAHATMTSQGEAPQEEMFQIEVSHTTREWMDEVIADAERPLTREMKVVELEASPRRSSGASLLLGLGGLVIAAFAAASVFNAPPKTTPPPLNLEVPEPAALDERAGLIQQPQSERADGDERADTSVDVVHGKGQASIQSATLTSQRTSKKQSSDLKELTQALDTPAPAAIDAVTGLDASASAARSDQASAKNTAKSSKDKKLVAYKSLEESSKKGAKKSSKKGAKKSSKKGAKKSSKKGVKKRAKKRVKKTSRTKKRGRPKSASSQKGRGKGLSKSTISTIIQQRAGGLRNCYQKVLKRDPNIGRVRTNLNFIVNPEGRVARSTVRLSRKYRSSRLEKCIQNIVVRWYFPKASGSSKVRYPLTLSPGF